MTTSAASDDHRAADRIVFRIVHYHALILFGLAAWRVLKHYFPDWALPDVAWFPLLALLAVSTFGIKRHDRSLCPACAEEFPLDASAQANGPQRPVLQRFHFFMDRPVITLAVLSAVVLAGFWVWWLAPTALVAFAVGGP